MLLQRVASAVPPLICWQQHEAAVFGIAGQPAISPRRACASKIVPPPQLKVREDIRKIPYDVISINASAHRKNTHRTSTRRSPVVIISRPGTGRHHAQPMPCRTEGQNAQLPATHAGAGNGKMILPSRSATADAESRCMNKYDEDLYIKDMDTLSHIGHCRADEVCQRQPANNSRQHIAGAAAV